MHQPQIFKYMCFHLWHSIAWTELPMGETAPVRGSTLRNASPDPLSPPPCPQTYIQTQFQWGLLYLHCSSGVFFMTAILFSVAPEELCNVFQSSTYKSSLHLSFKCSYCCWERILEECGPAFHSLIWSLWFMVYHILLPLPAALLSWGLFCSISYSQGTNELWCPMGLSYTLYLSPFISVTSILYPAPQPSWLEEMGQHARDEIFWIVSFDLFRPCFSQNLNVRPLLSLF